MEFDREISKVKSILGGKFSSKEDKKYWEDKLADLQDRQARYKDTQEAINKYEKQGFRFQSKYKW